ncbi:hypothetical protein LX15_005284 [Streptoalloteichus tenebrarius]|uniref:Uncharacterized protein n=1 Tax=Streptoalloteichus tenebrarius (strain ATCC 17920 / DSM 40477 / JCM 4838 / CBS 697.72 / NBRC 16177 / NCIMB 11028 / NRRL B-12390 / A12253. 1 / ISP 5477) TaxID=1933 RepID=A0ABT1I192_STRSD|nr:hypothetical protein [Streptoalloteichus tenebrarius]BFF02666.1 hypothetical protein GCM10020241_43410 [Streptoalloteichus tenebrarius]
MTDRAEALAHHALAARTSTLTHRRTPPTRPGGRAPLQPIEEHGMAEAENSPLWITQEAVDNSAHAGVVFLPHKGFFPSGA